MVRKPVAITLLLVVLLVDIAFSNFLPPTLVREPRKTDAIDEKYGRSRPSRQITPHQSLVSCPSGFDPALLQNSAPFMAKPAELKLTVSDPAYSGCKHSIYQVDSNVLINPNLGSETHDKQGSGTTYDVSGTTRFGVVYNNPDPLNVGAPESSYLPTHAVNFASASNSYAGDTSYVTTATTFDPLASTLLGNGIDDLGDIRGEGMNGFVKTVDGDNYVDRVAHSNTQSAYSLVRMDGVDAANGNVPSANSDLETLHPSTREVFDSSILWSNFFGGAQSDFAPGSSIGGMPFNDGSNPGDDEHNVDKCSLMAINIASVTNVGSFVGLPRDAVSPNNDLEFGAITILYESANATKPPRSASEGPFGKQLENDGIKVTVTPDGTVEDDPVTETTTSSWTGSNTTSSTSTNSTMTTTSSTTSPGTNTSMPTFKRLFEGDKQVRNKNFLYGAFDDEDDYQEFPTLYDPRANLGECPMIDAPFMAGFRDQVSGKVIALCGDEIPGKRSEDDPYELDSNGKRGTNGFLRFNFYWRGRYWWWSKFFRHQLPVPTHFWSSINDGRGGYFFGMGDGINKIEFVRQDSGQGAITLVQKDDFDFAPKSNSFYNIFRWNLLSETAVASQRGTDFQIYVGRNFSLYAVTNRAATFFSDNLVFAAGRFKGIHKNSRTARFGPWWWFRWFARYPFYQFIHNWPIKKNNVVISLATYVLPPFWSWYRSADYPVLYDGGEDTNAQVFIGSGLDLIGLMGFSYVVFGENGLHILVFHNSGGAYGHSALHDDVHDSHVEVMNICRTQLNCDRNRVVAIGVSRSAVDAWSFCFNPLNTGPNAYTCKYLATQFPSTHPGDWLHIAFRYVETYPQIAFGYSEYTGYATSYISSWFERGTYQSGQQLAIQTILGHFHRIRGNDNGPHGAVVNGDIDAKGTNIGFSFGTHDPIMYGNMLVRFANELWQHTTQNASIAMWYRGGHNVNGEMIGAHIVTAVFESAAGSYAAFNGEFLTFRRATEATLLVPSLFTVSLSDIPSALTAPRVMKVGTWFALDITTGHNKYWRVTLTKISDIVWKHNQTIVDNGPEVNMWTGHATPLTHGGTVLQNHLETILLSPQQKTGLYRWRLYESFDGSSFTPCDDSHVPQPIDGVTNPDPRYALGVSQPFPKALVEVVNPKFDPAVPGPAFAALFAPGGLAWGISCETTVS